MPPTDLPDLRTLLLDPQADPLEVGLVLRGLTQDDIEALGFRHMSRLLWHLLEGADRPDYSTVMRWVSAARVLEGPDDPRRGWGVARLCELAYLSSSHRLGPFLERHDPGAMSVRQLRAAVRAFVAPDRPVASEPHEVLARAACIALRREGLAGDRDPVVAEPDEQAMTGFSLEVRVPAEGPVRSATMRVVSSVLDAVADAKSAWHRGPRGRRLPDPMPLADVLALPPGQLEAHWEASNAVRVSKGGQPVLWLPVERVPPTEHRIVAPGGNEKTAGMCGIIDSLSQGCLRAATGYPGCDVPCFELVGEGRSGCYAQHTPWARAKTAGKRRSRKHRFSIVDNGLANPFMHVRLPARGTPRLPRSDVAFWRVDAETSTGCMSIALGIFQSWAEANPGEAMMTLSAHVFRPSDEMLAWTAALRNTWVGHTVSASLSEAELDVRFDAIRRFLSFGIPGTIWIVTHRSWDNGRVLRRALELVPSDRIIESPYRYGTVRQDLPLLNVNELGACSDVRERRNRTHDRMEVRWVEDPDTSGDTAVLVGPDGHATPLRNPASKCKGCRLRCGMHVLQDRHQPD